MKSTKNYWCDIEKIKGRIRAADAVLIGAGAGLSCAAGLVYAGKRFEDNFQDFIAKYHLTDMYSAGFYPWQTLEEYWAYWSRHIFLNRYQPMPTGVYNDLLRLIENKNYFVLTTNVDHCFQKAGFDKQRLFYTQGDYGLWQCPIPCHRKTYENKEMVRKMVAEQKNMRIPIELIPHCPICGKPMTMNLRVDGRFAEDEGWHKAAERYQLFLEENNNTNIVYLELGVGDNTPAIIKYPFWKRTARNKNATYVCINLADIYAPANIANQSICMAEDIAETLKDLNE